MEQILEKLRNKTDLSFEESKSAFELLMTGQTNEDQIYDFLTLLSDKGEVSDEIAGGVYVLREKSKRLANGYNRRRLAASYKLLQFFPTRSAAFFVVSAALFRDDVRAARVL